MTKVLGFIEKEAKVKTEVDTYYQIEKEDLVPVVSLEAIKEWCKHNEVQEIDARCLRCGEGTKVKVNTSGLIQQKDLLSWAKKEAGKK